MGASGTVHRMPVPDDQDRPVLGLIAELGRELSAAGVRYCHWKSNEAIGRSLSGLNDLDLLVSPEDAGRFLEVLHRLGFRIVRTRADRDVPGIVDLLGLDDTTGTVVHAQAHFRLVVGDDMTKNVHLPLEDAYLASCSDDGILPLPRPEFEYLVFLLRMGIKHTPAPAQLALQGRLTASERRELAYLERRIDHEEVDRLRARYLPTIDAELLATCRAAFEPRSGRRQRAIAGRRLTQALAPYGRRSPATDLALRIWRRPWRRIQVSLLGVDVRRRAGSGGALIGVVGGDGSGKSTTVAALAATLDRMLVTHVGHLGKPPRSLTTRVGRRLLRFGGGASPGMALPPWEEGPLDFPGYGFVLWHVLNARDRAAAYRRLSRAAGAGAVVICDRFPHPVIRYMDGPRTVGLPGLERRPLARRLAELERRFYRGMAPPDVLLVLRVPPDVAVARRPEQDERYVWHRAQEVFEARWPDENVVVLDASRPLDEVLRSARRAVWEVL
jgi:thymidylate kinase